MPIRRCSGVPTRNRPPNDQNACPPSIRLGFLVEQRAPAARLGQLRGGGQSRQPRAYHDRVCVHLVIKAGHRSAFIRRPGTSDTIGWCQIPVTEFDASRSCPRVYDYLLGGKDNFAADRAVADQMIASLSAVQVGVRAQRDVLGRVVRYLVGEVGLRQLLDIGSGLPTAENVHEIAQRRPGHPRRLPGLRPGSSTPRRALLAHDKGTFAAAGDLSDPAGILSHGGGTRSPGLGRADRAADVRHPALHPG